MVAFPKRLLKPKSSRLTSKTNDRPILCSTLRWMAASLLPFKLNIKRENHVVAPSVGNASALLCLQRALNRGDTRNSILRNLELSKLLANISNSCLANAMHTCA